MLRVSLAFAAGSLALGLTFGSFARVASAQEADTSAQARQHYDQGLTHYNLSEWDEAIKEFKAAYGLSKAPGLLYNIAQAYRLKGDKAMALSNYKAYLRLEPGASNRAEVEARIADLDKAIAEDRKREDHRGTPPKETPPKPAPPTTQGVMRVDAKVMRVEVNAKKGNQTMMRAGLITAGVGVVIVGVGTYFGVKAAQSWGEVERIDTNRLDWGETEMGFWDDAQDQELTAKILIGVGSVALATGGVLYFFGARATGDAQLSALPTRGGAVVGMSCGF